MFWSSFLYCLHFSLKTVFSVSRLSMIYILKFCMQLSLDETLLSNVTEFEAMNQSTLGSSKNLRLFTRKPASDLFTKLREAKSKNNDKRGCDFVGFYSPMHQRNPRQFGPESPLFHIQPNTKHKEPASSTLPVPSLPRRQGRQTPPPNPSPSQTTPRKERCPKKQKQNSSAQPEQVRNPRMSLKDESFIRQNWQNMTETNRKLREENAQLRQELEETKTEAKDRERELGEERLKAQYRENSHRDRIGELETVMRDLRRGLQEINKQTLKKDTLILNMEKQNNKLLDQIENLKISVQKQRIQMQEQVNYLLIELETFKKRRYDCDQSKKTLTYNQKLIKANKQLRILNLHLRQKAYLAQCHHRDELFQLSPQKENN